VIGVAKLPALDSATTLFFIQPLGLHGYSLSGQTEKAPEPLDDPGALGFILYPF
jgi:hypothetical protein